MEGLTTTTTTTINLHYYDSMKTFSINLTAINENEFKNKFKIELIKLIDGNFCKIFITPYFLRDVNNHLTIETIYNILKTQLINDINLYVFRTADCISSISILCELCQNPNNINLKNLFLCSHLYCNNCDFGFNITSIRRCPFCRHENTTMQNNNMFRRNSTNRR